MKNTYKYMALFLLILFIAELFILNNFKNARENDIFEYESSIAISRANLNIVKENMISQMSYQNTVFDNNICKDTDKQETNLKELISKNTLVIFIKRSYCSPCVENAIAEITNDSKLKENAIIICYNFTFRDMSRLYRDWDTDIKCVSYVDEDEKLSVFKNLTQSIFVLNNDLTMQDMFYPLIYADELTESYLDMISNKYFE